MKNEEFTVELELHAQFPLTEERLASVAELGGVAGGKVGEQSFTTTITVTSDSVTGAIDKALRLVLDRVLFTIRKATAMPVEEFDRREEERALIVGVTEIAEMLGISRQRVTTLSRRADFPAPLQRLAAGPVWRKGDLSTFAEGWQRKGGRPRKMKAASAEAPARA